MITIRVTIDQSDTDQGKLFLLDNFLKLGWTHNKTMNGRPSNSITFPVYYDHTSKF